MKTNLQKKLLAFAFVSVSLLSFDFISHSTGLKNDNQALAGTTSIVSAKDVVLYLADMGFTAVSIDSTNDGTGNYIVKTDTGIKFLVVVCSKGIMGIDAGDWAGSL